MSCFVWSSTITHVTPIFWLILDLPFGCLPHVQWTVSPSLSDYWKLRGGREGRSLLSFPFSQRYIVLGSSGAEKNWFCLEKCRIMWAELHVAESYSYLGKYRTWAGTTIQSWQHRFLSAQRTYQQKNETQRPSGTPEWNSTPLKALISVISAQPSLERMVFQCLSSILVSRKIAFLHLRWIFYSRWQPTNMYHGSQIENTTDIRSFDPSFDDRAS